MVSMSLYIILWRVPKFYQVEISNKTRTSQRALLHPWAIETGLLRRPQDGRYSDVDEVGYQASCYAY